MRNIYGKAAQFASLSHIRQEKPSYRKPLQTPHSDWRWWMWVSLTSVSCTERRACESVRTCKPMLIGQRCPALLTLMTRTYQGRARNKAVHATRPRTPQGQVNNVWPITWHAFKYRQKISWFSAYWHPSKLSLLQEWLIYLPYQEQHWWQSGHNSIQEANKYW